MPSKSIDLPKSHRDGPDFINVLKYLDIPAGDRPGR